MVRLPLLSLCLIGLAAPAWAQASPAPSSSDLPSAALSMSAPPGYSSGPAPDDALPAEPDAPAPPPVASADLLQALFTTCTDIIGGDSGAFDRANDAGWVPSDDGDPGPYSHIYAGYRDFDGYGEVQIWAAVQHFPTQQLGYCAVTFSDPGNQVEFDQLTGMGELDGTVHTLVEDQSSFGSWERPDKRLLVLANRIDGSINIEFNLLPGAAPVQN